MKYYICLTFLVPLCGIQAVEHSYWMSHIPDNKLNLGYHNYNDIEKPCSVYDVHCIQNYLQYKFGCSPVYGHHQEPFYVKSFSLAMANGNATAVVSDIELYGLGAGKIKTFYINRKTDTMVLGVAFESVLMKSPHALVSYYRPGKDPIKTDDYVIFNFRDFSLTWTVEGINNNISKSHVYAYAYDNHPVYKLGPKFLTNDQKNAWVWNMASSIAEAMVTQGPMIMTAYMKSNVCNLQL